MPRAMALAGGVVCLSGALVMAVPQPRAQDAPTGSQTWAQIYAVLSHPRCANCHVEDDRPRWSGANNARPRPHAMNVMRGESGFGNAGMRCSTCHKGDNAPLAHAPPGAPAWHLAPAVMAWFGKPSAEVCEQLKDPERNGGRTLDEVAEHVRSDKLVAWGWAPGASREPAPGSAEQTFRLLEEWTAAGAPCPRLPQ
jgi:hypothetical protein